MTEASAATREQERAVGITAFVSPDAPGFACTIKHRYTDFLVNEISSDGTVLRLTNDRASKNEKKGHGDVANGTSGSGAGAEPKHGNGSGLEESSEKRKRLQEDGDAQTTGGSSPSKKPRVEGHQTANTPPEPGAPDAGNETAAATTPAASTDRRAEIIATVSESDQDRLHNIFGEGITKQVLNLYANVVIHPDRKPRDQPTIRSEVISEKPKRTEAHVAVREVFASKLSTETLQDLPGVIAIKAAPTKGPSGARGQPNSDSNGAYQKGKLGWDELGGEYVHFTLYKENKDTMEALYFIASQLKIPVKNFQFAGTKDRRGVTVQRVAIFRVHADRIAKLNRVARGWRLGNFEYRKHGLELGELGGNEFLLTLRDCHFSGEEGLTAGQRVALAQEAVEKATASFKQRGFLNYYGLQRFGTFRTGTHTTGMKMLQGDLEGAIDSILAYSDNLLPENVDTSGSAKIPQDDINRADAIKMWREKSSTTEASTKLPRRFQAEAAIIQYLGKKDRKSGKLLQEKDWQGALMQIQRNLRSMYVHAYQSFVWNTVAGRRWELYGDKVVEGDLVIVGDKDGKTPEKDQVDEDGEPIFHPAGDDSAQTTEDPYTRARHLTKEDAESGRYDIFDVVLPLPGFDVLYPANEVGKFYEEFMASEVGGSMNPHQMRRAWKDISLSGGYRKMFARPGEDFSYEIKTYVNGEEQMVQTDLERLQKRSVDGQEAASGEGGSGLHVKPANGVDGTDMDEKIAVVLKLQLGSSQYATMALRELTKGGAFNYKPEFSSR
jgi:tRNA pseudouridine13 synthase